MPRKRRRNRLYWKSGRAYADYRDLGGKLEAVKPPGSKLATNDGDVATALIAERVKVLESIKRGIAIIGRGQEQPLGPYAQHHLTRKKQLAEATDWTLGSLQLQLERAVEFFGAAKPLRFRTERVMSDQDADFGPQYISPRFTREKISPGVFTDWVDVWEDRFRGWWLAHAHALRGKQDGAFLIVHVAVGLIEALEVAYQGKDSEGQSAQFFSDGFCRMFSGPTDSALPPADAASVLYKAVRCGLSHTAMLKGPVFLVDDERIPPLQINATVDGKIVDSVIINPTKFLDVVTMQFDRYVNMLRHGRGPEADERRKRFEDVWHLLHARELPQPASARK